LIKNSQPFGKKSQKTAGKDFFDSHCIILDDNRADEHAHHDVACT